MKHLCYALVVVDLCDACHLHQTIWLEILRVNCRRFKLTKRAIENDAPHLQRLKRSEQVDNANEHNSLSNRNLWVFLENGKHRLEISNINTVLRLCDAFDYTGGFLRGEEG